MVELIQNRIPPGPLFSLTRLLYNEAKLFSRNAMKTARRFL
ncbi:hypothetical protein HMPREF0239_04311 [Clostridium sp. ATCC BAA-442]|uniref:Uncharacterized protein n=1 Tax=Flavonifractor plautii ATCC 29863 TaxID=411475 RepID=G9YSJ3_FLAPL|nr:hypothetical protein HMPREF0372_02501 [Flavonifractor plautii ATCC 29863]ERI64926.1 hypothetical protein HMPREF0239_04311 [Clostridium sp. ATCC BAA-442]